MMIKVIAPSSLLRDIKRLKKKYPNVTKDLRQLNEKLGKGEILGDAVAGFSHHVYKVRVASSDQKRGKRGGFRVVYYVVMDDEEIYLLTMYAKAQQENIRASEIQFLIDQLAEKK